MVIGPDPPHELESDQPQWKLQFTINGKPVAEGLAEFRERFKAALEGGLKAVGEAILDQAEVVVGEGYARKFEWTQTGVKTSVEWPWLAEATINYYARMYNIKIETPADHPGLIDPDESRELITSLSGVGAPHNVFLINRDADGMPVEVRVGSNVPYALKHEMGGWQMWGKNEVYVPPRPYMVPALYLVADSGKLVDILSRRAREIMRQFGEMDGDGTD